MPRIIPTPTPQEQEVTRLEQQLRGKDVRIADLQKTVDRERAEADKWRGKFDELLALKEPMKPRPLLLPAMRSGEMRGIAQATWSDWHVGEKIEKAKARGLNTYSPEICRKRVEECTAGTIRLFRHVRRSYSVDTMVLFLGGDFITGYLHPELEQTNYYGPVQEGRVAEELLIGAIGHLAEEKGLRKLRIVAMRGNHGRTTKKMQFKNDFESSYETWIYAHLASLFKSPRIEWDIPQGDVHSVEILPATRDRSAFRNRYFHGHQIKYSDGIGGLTIPLNKWEAKQDATEKCALNDMAHYHYYSEPNGRTTLNGSLKGYDEYAASHGFPFQEPLQAFKLIDVDRRMVAQRMPIFCSR